MGDDFTFSGVVGAGTGVEEAAVDGDEGIVEFRFSETVAVGVHLLLISLGPSDGIPEWLQGH